MPDEMTAKILALATEYGASAVGVTTADVFEAELQALKVNKSSGHSGPLRFTYDDPDTATDIRRTLPWAKRLLVVGHNYLGESGTPDQDGAVVARFATANHYERLGQITDAVAAELVDRGYRAEVLIDDNRLVDRAAATRAGVGWSGRNTMVLTPAHGPWMLLGSVVTDAPLEPSHRMERTCGTCVACFPACPTDALDDRGLDARRCLSTWLQTPGSIPQWIRPHLGRRVYGCDDCLTACPPGSRSLARAGEHPVSMPFPKMLAMTDDELLERFSWWYVPRREGRFIRRNLLIAAGNSGEPDALDSIESHLLHASSMIRGHAAWAVAKGHGAEAMPVLERALEGETVAEAHDELTLALLMVGNPQAHRGMLEADEWVWTNEPLRALASTEQDLLVVSTEPEGTQRPDTSRLIRVLSPRDLTTAPLADAVIVYDPDRLLENARRRERQVTSL